MENSAEPVGFRWVDGCPCMLKTCSKQIKPHEDAVVVATDEKIRRSIDKRKEGLYIAWVPSGRTVLHKDCWNEVLSKEKTEFKLPKEISLVHSASETEEYFDSLPLLMEKVKKAAELIRSAKSMVAFTGAGLSTSAGIADYRGTQGVDTKTELGHKTKKQKLNQDNDEQDVDYEKLLPTAAHEALVTLQDNGSLKYIVTQNCDHLHMRAGTKRKLLSELHGNVFIEYCEKCNTEYERDYCVDLWSTNCYLEPWYVKCSRCRLNHYTGRTCNKKGCKGKLKDTIVNFGDFLHDTVCGGLQRAEKQCKKADVILALGSSLAVYPANSLLDNAQFLVICNLQKTSYDKKCAVRIFATCDSFMQLLLQELHQAPHKSKTIRKI